MVLHSTIRSFQRAVMDRSAFEKRWCHSNANTTLFDCEKKWHLQKIHSNSQLLFYKKKIPLYDSFFKSILILYTILFTIKSVGIFYILYSRDYRFGFGFLHIFLLYLTWRLTFRSGRNNSMQRMCLLAVLNWDLRGSIGNPLNAL